MLPPRGLAVHLLPLEADDVGQQPLGQPVPTHDRRREVAALVGEVQAAIARELDEALTGQPPDRLGDGRRRESEPLDQPGPHRHDAFFLEREDRLEVLLGRVVQLGHRVSFRTTWQPARAVQPRADNIVGSAGSGPVVPAALRRPVLLHSRYPSARLD